MRVGIIYHGFAGEAETLAARLSGQYADTASWWRCAVDESPSIADEAADTDLIVAIGGDGTILRSAHVASPHGIPILGVNLGRVGFMSEIEAEDALDGVGWYLEGNARIETRTMISAVIGKPASGEAAEQHHALNDVVLGRGREIRLMDIALSVGGIPLTTYRADALVVATATGSTGYSLALGGPVMDPEERSFLVKPVASHMSLQGGILVAPGSVVKMTLETSTVASCSVDGSDAFNIHRGDSVTVEVSEHTARFLRRRPAAAFYDGLTRRLGMRQGSMPRAARELDE